jgi:hypothetical protein
MPRIITMDSTAIKELNKDNRPLADFFNSLRGVNLSIINDAHLQMAESEYSKLNEAERALADDMGVRHMNGSTRTSQLPNVDSRARYVQQIDPDAFKNIAPEHEATISLAFGSELLTFDPKLAETYGKITARLQDKLVPELRNIPVSNKPLNYNLARTNLGLKPLNISQSTGGVLPTPSVTRVMVAGKTTGFVDAEGNSISASGGPRTPGGARTTRQIDNVVGEALTAPQEHGPSSGGEAAFQAGVLLLQGANELSKYLLKKIYGPVQQRRFEEVRNRKMPFIEQQLNEDPQLGAMIFVYYSTFQGGEASVVDAGTPIFNDLHVAFGFTKDEALRAYNSVAHITAVGPGSVYIGDTIWIKPRAPLDIKKLQLPVGAEVAGLATFVPGKEKFVRVSYSILAGFDDRALSRERVEVPKDMVPRFFYLWPPKCITYMYNGMAKQADVDTAMSGDADESANVIIKPFKGIPVVKLDSHFNPSTWVSDGATAAMIWPADNATANLFQTTQSTSDPRGLLAGKGFGMVRWIRPEFVRVLRDPVF